MGQQYLTILVFHRLTPAPSSIRSLEMILYSDIPPFVYTNCRKHRVRQGEVAETKPVNTIRRNGETQSSRGCRSINKTSTVFHSADEDTHAEDLRLFIKRT